MRNTTKRITQFCPTNEDTEYNKLHPGWLEMLKAFQDSGYTGQGAVRYLESHKHHDPMDDGPNRDRNCK